MWPILIVVFAAMLSGLYRLPAERRQEVVDRQQSAEVAETMGEYRQAVVAYFKANDVTDTSVSLDDLKLAGVLPGWSRLSTGTAAAAWTNYRDSTGRIYIFPAAAGTPPITTELLTLSRNSLNVGIYRAADQTLLSPVDGARIALPPLGGAVIPDGAPVWMATCD